MMRRALVLLLILAACGGPKIAPAPLSPAEQACTEQASQDPAVKEVEAIAAGRLDYQWQHEPEIAQIKRDAVTRCLRARGLAPRGGVERPR